MKQFESDEAAGYDLSMPLRVPLYLGIQQLAGTLLEAHLGPSARVLVVGAGTGTEITAMAQANPGWHFTAVDPSAAMLGIAAEKAARNGVLDRVRLLECRIEDLTVEREWDGAVALLVSHFMPDDGAKARFFGAVSDALAPRAPFVLADLIDMEEGGALGLRATWPRWATAQGGDPQAVARMMARVETAFHPVTESRLHLLLREQGFDVFGRFVQALEFAGYLCFKRGSAHE